MAYFKQQTPVYYHGDDNNNNININNHYYYNQTFINQNSHYNDHHEYYNHNTNNNNNELEIIRPQPIELHHRFDYFYNFEKKETTAKDFLMKFNNDDDELFKDFDGVHYVEREEELSKAAKRNSYFSDITDDTSSDDDCYMNDDTYSVPTISSPNEYTSSLPQNSTPANEQFDFETPLVKDFSLSAEERYRIQMRQHYERRLRDIQQDFDDQMIEQEVVGLMDEWHLDDHDEQTEY